jgi:hypothetical protein
MKEMSLYAVAYLIFCDAPADMLGSDVSAINLRN